MNLTESRFWGLFEHSPYSVQILTPDGYTVMVNPAYKKLWLASDEVLEKFIGRKEYNILQDKNLEDAGLMPYIKRGFAGETVEVPPFYYEPMKLGIPARARWTGGYVIPLKDENNQIVEVAIIHLDVSDKYELTIEREKILKESQEAINLRDEFISIASHELRTPISSLGLQIEVLSNIIQNIQTPEAEQVKKVMNYTRGQLDRLTRLVDDMLDSSRIAVGKMNLEKQVINMNELVRNVLDRFHNQLENLNIKLNFSCAEKVMVNCDPHRVDQVITNLMTNAIRYGNLKPISVAVEGLGDKCIIEVSDQGRGIAREDQERIFNRFERGKSAEDVAGLGLGLFINRQIIEEHDGNIYVESELGKGSTFVIELPLK